MGYAIRTHRFMTARPIRRKTSTSRLAESKELLSSFASQLDAG